MLNRGCKTLFLSLCVLHLLARLEGHTLRKRTVSEVQLMHNLGEHKQVQERLEWLQRRLQGIYSLGPNNNNNNNSSSSNPGWGRKGIAFREQPNLRDLTLEEIQYAINALEELLKSQP